MKKWVFILLIVFFVLASNVKVSYVVAEERPLNVLIIHAYHLGYPWTYNQNEGIRKGLLEYDSEMNIFTEFLDWKRFPDEVSIELQYQTFKNKYKDVSIDLILTTDDMGLEFALANRAELFNNAPIAFSGIIGQTAMEIIGNEQDVTGVYENMEAEGMIDLLKLLQPDVNHLYLVHDLSESGIRTKDVFFNAIESTGTMDDYEITDLSELTNVEIEGKLATLDKKSAVILISYNISVDGIVLKPEVFCQRFNEVSSVPMYSIDEFLFGEGIVGGTFLSGVLQGEVLANLGVQILQGTDPDSLPHISEATVYTGVDEEIVQKYELSLHGLEEDVVIINEEFSFFEEYRSLVLAVFGIVIGLLIFIIILLFMIDIIHKSKKKVLGQKIELQDLYEQQKQTEEELCAQNEELQTYQEQLEFEVYHDFLTRLPNRIALSEKIEDIFKKALMGHEKVLIVFIDLDNFKYVNNTFGHQFGDDVLKHMSKLLVRSGGNAFVARIGGDEFVMVKPIPSTMKAKEIERIVTVIAREISKEVNIGKELIKLTASLGYSVFPEDGSSFDELIIEADVAMYEVKKEGKASSRRYKKAMSNILQNNYILLSNLKQAIKDNEFYIVYQPLFKADAQSIYGFEALIRWNSSVHGQVQPNKFIPLAETSGLIIPIGDIVIEKSLDFAIRLMKKYQQEFVISINVSIIQFYEDTFVDNLLERIENSGINPSQVQIEITESVMIDTYSLMIEKLKYLRTRDISIALDDFGTGYSSLSYIHELPIDELKIDKVFVDDIGKKMGNSPLVDTTIMLAKSFGFKVIAEGVESKEQLDYLYKEGCDYIQGFYLCKPKKENELINYLDNFYSPTKYS